MDAITILKILAVSLPLTFVLEALILLAFRFSFRLNWKPLLIINACAILCLQLWAAADLVFTSPLFGLFGGQFMYGGIELVVFAAKAVLFAFLLKQHSKLRRVLFSVVASAVSYILVMGLVFALLFLQIL